MPTVLKHEGFRLFFYSNEGDEPPHVHNEKANGLAKFWLLPDVELAWTKSFHRRELSRLVRLIEEHQRFFLEKWDEHFEG